MKKLLFVLNLLLSISAYGQSFNEDKTSMVNFIKRMYKATPFEGVKIVDDYDRQYLVSVLSLDKTKYANPSIMNRVSQVKAQSLANTFLNGATNSTDIIIITKESKVSVKNVKTIVETIEQLKQNSIGFSQGLELATNFEDTDSLRMIFVYLRELKK